MHGCVYELSVCPCENIIRCTEDFLMTKVSKSVKKVLNKCIVRWFSSIKNKVYDSHASKL